MTLRAVHLLDDPNLGGVTRALRNFDDPRLTALAAFETVYVSRRQPPPRLDADVAIVHFTVNTGFAPWLHALRLRNRPMRVVLVEHSYSAAFEARHAPSRLRFRAMLRASYAACDRVVAVSHGQARWLGEIGLRAPKLCVIAQSIDLAAYLQIDPPPRRVGPLRVGGLGRFCDQKGFDTLIEAARGVLPGEARFIIAGYGEDEQALRAASAGLEHVQISGPVNPLEFYGRIDVLAAPSRREPFGLVASEAMAAARPVLASHVDGLPEQLADPGWAVAVDDAEAWRKAIGGLAALSPEAFERLAERSRAAAAPRYDAMIENWRVLLGEIAAAMPARHGGRAGFPQAA